MHYADGRYGTCSTCGKQSYRDRRMAKKAAQRIHPGDKLSVYQCDGGNWHYGHLSKNVKSGRVDRTVYREQRNGQ